MTRTRSRSARRLATVVGTAALAVTTLAGPAAAAPSCSTPWGSTPEVSDAASTGTVDGIRAGRHACYDRLVIDLDLPAGVSAVGYDVRYVPTFRADGSGTAIPLRGGADLQVVIDVPAYVDGRATYTPANRTEVVPVSGYDTFRQVAWGGSYEATTTVGVGVRARTPFRTFVVGSGEDARLVLDVAHTW
ncbi:AMIN-like domain-containing (lipo)protein [Blastococcus sp. SYSU D00820]